MTSLDVLSSVHQVHGLMKQVAHPHLKLLLDTSLVVGAVLLQDQLQEEKIIKVTTIAVWRSRGVITKVLVGPRKGVARKGGVAKL